MLGWMVCAALLAGGAVRGQDVLLLGGAVCGQGAALFLGSCYTVSSRQETFAGAQQQCQRTGSNLVEITSPEEDLSVGLLLETSGRGAASFWTGAVVTGGHKFWHGTQTDVCYDRRLDVGSGQGIPEGIVIREGRRTRPEWRTEDFDKLNFYICEFPADDVGCLDDDDPQGERYRGRALHDEYGIACLPWDQTDGADWESGHSFCRNPDNDEKPYCYIEKDNYSYCSIPACSSNLTRTPTPTACQPTQHNHNTCSKEEYACPSGSCIAKLHVCDDEIDCPGGEDEMDCRRFSSLFVQEDGYRQQGVAALSAEETTLATEEECAKLCYYSKQCCNSFSSRPGSGGLEELCLLGTVFKNQVFDTVAQNSSWNYHKLNETNRREGLGYNCSQRTRRGPKEGENGARDIQGLRLTSSMADRAISTGTVLEVKANGNWVGLCYDGNKAKANWICKEMGFESAEENKGRSWDRRALPTIHCEPATSLADCRLEAGQCQAGQAGITCHQKTEVRLTETEYYRQKNGESSGVLEVKHDGVWGTVCRENFSSNEAAVFCRMLGLHGSVTWSWVQAETQRRRPAREGSWPVWITLRPEDAGKCWGTENSIVECHGRELWDQAGICEHNEDIVLTCSAS